MIAVMVLMALIWSWKVPLLDCGVGGVEDVRRGSTYLARSGVILGERIGWTTKTRAST
jgi:hypothetical protein